MSENIVSVNNLSVSFDYQENFLSKKQKIKAVNNINIKIKKGSFFGLVGESGSGKTTLGRAILGANKISQGNVIFHDDERDYDLTTITSKEMKDYRKKAQLIFQDPYAALSPRMTVRDIIAEPLEVMRITNSREETDARVRDIAAKCRLNLEHLRRFPHAFSGGQRQRISIARALVSNPKFILAVMIDEPSIDGYYGGVVAGPAFQSIMSDALKLYSIPQDGKKIVPSSDQKMVLLKN